MACTRVPSKAPKQSLITDPVFPLSSPFPLSPALNSFSNGFYKWDFCCQLNNVFGHFCHVKYPAPLFFLEGKPLSSMGWGMGGMGYFSLRVSTSRERISWCAKCLYISNPLAVLDI
eukprot:TRINITY_DN21249_c0_g4_i2.p1 TRINITY_DN21249_c0_g4~~TRINITY_DN21249_c0_g4_i2.p1  ORF type:complete len:116 (+),score=6.16 TRINITY_DN21249_c0_g4_i2:46-393(+)